MPANRVLFVDLTRGTTRVEDVPPELTRQFVGGRGYNAHLLWRLGQPGREAYDPEAPLIFGAGALSGTSAPSSGRTTVTGKSPQTGLYFKSSVGGKWGAELAASGYRHIVVTGEAAEPCYLLVGRGGAEMRSARRLWGRGVRETDAAIRAEAGNRPGLQVACIGPAGENGVTYAAVMMSVYNAAARGGAGAIMGRKRLKAIAVPGGEPVDVADPGAFRRAARTAYQAVTGDSAAEGLHQYGTAGSVIPSNETYGFPSYNFRMAKFEEAAALSGQALITGGYLRRRVACFACPLGCHRFTTIEAGPYAGCFSGGPEYETVSALGSGCGLADTEAVIQANALCNDLGLDTISTGAAVQWLMECAERGVLPAADLAEFGDKGQDLTWGNAQAVHRLIRQIGTETGLGRLVARGIHEAAREVGQGSLAWAVEARGLEQSRVDVRTSRAYALAFAVNPRGPDHLHTEPIAEYGATAEARAIVRQLTGDDRFADPFISEWRAEIVRWHEDIYGVADSLGLCAFSCTMVYSFTPDMMADLANAALGTDLSGDELMACGRRIVNLERCLNLREGLRPEVDDTLPVRMLAEQPADLPPTFELEDLAVALPRMLKEYYRLHGWGPTGRPTHEGLTAIGLADVADELERTGRLAQGSGGPAAGLLSARLGGGRGGSRS